MKFVEGLLVAFHRLAKLLCVLVVLLLFRSVFGGHELESKLVITSVFAVFFSFATMSLSWARLFEASEPPHVLLRDAAEGYVMASVFTVLAQAFEFFTGEPADPTMAQSALSLLHSLTLLVAFAFGTRSSFTLIDVWYLRRARDAA
jgi:hypothetical protein